MPKVEGWDYKARSARHLRIAYIQSFSLNVTK